MAHGRGPWKYTARDGTVSWRIRVELPPDPLTGERRRQQRTYRTKGQAQSALNTWLKEIDEGTVILASDTTLGAYVQHWLSTVKARVRPGTYAGYDQLARTHLLPALGHIRLQRLDRQHAEALYGRLLGEGGRKDGHGGPLSRRTTRKVHDLLKRICTEAHASGLLQRNPLLGIKPPKPEPQRVEFWTAADVATFLAACEGGDIYGGIWYVALHTGLRVGELLGLRWEDCALDIPRPELRVRQILTDLKGHQDLQPVPKSDAGTRAVALSTKTVEALRKHQACQLAQRKAAGTSWEHPELVFPNTQGGLMNPRNLTRRFEQLMRSSGVKRIRFHDLRHTHATLLMLAGVNPKVVSERMGHKDVAFTLRVYSHVLPQMQTDAAEAFDRTVLEASQKRPATRRPQEPENTTPS